MLFKIYMGIYLMIKNKAAAFKAYDIRGTLGETLDEDMVFEIGRALIEETSAKNVAIGADARPSSPSLKNAMIEGMRMQGANVIDLGSTGTEEIYFAAQYLDIDLGVEVTASHNPIGDNGLKFIKRGGVPVQSPELMRIRDRVVSGIFQDGNMGMLSSESILEPYVDHLLTYIDVSLLADFKILTNAGNGMAGHVIDAIEERIIKTGLASPFVKMHHEPDPSFPNGIPNPLIASNQPVTANKVRETGADIGVAWDGDFDRCFFFDEKGQFIEGYYIVGMLAEAFLAKTGPDAVVYDPRLTWSTIERVENAGGKAIQAPVGHAFIKAIMREHNAVYGGEMSAHHYFRDFGYCDSGMIPWMLVVELLSKSGKSLSELVEKAQAEFPCSGEINFKVEDAKASIAKIRAHFEDQNPQIDEMDGLSMDFGTWRVNIRASNTEPLLRLNVESRGNRVLMDKMTDTIKTLIF